MAKKSFKKNARIVSNTRPVGITILGILAYLGAAFTLLGGILMIVGSALVRPIIENIAPEYLGWASVGSIGVVMLGIVFLACAVLNYFIAKGLMNGQNWARILVLVLSVLSLLSSLWPIDIVGILITGLIIWYVGFNKEAVKYFK